MQKKENDKKIEKGRQAVEELPVDRARKKDLLKGRAEKQRKEQSSVNPDGGKGLKNEKM